MPLGNFSSVKAVIIAKIILMHLLSLGASLVSDGFTDDDDDDDNDVISFFDL